MFDVAILGGGPAGATAARLLAQWGYRVVVLTASPGRRPPLAECVPPSTRKLFRFLGILEAINGAGFFRTTGNTVWWGKSGRRVEPYTEGFGYEVLRSDFDRLLLQLAEQAGARIRNCKVIRAAPPWAELDSGRVRAKYLLDCSGRAGVMARAHRVKDAESRTVALCGVWRNQDGWKLPDASHTLVEAYGDGWAWSVPVSPEVRYVALMVDPGETRMARASGLETAYRAELAKTRAFRRIFSKGALEGVPWGCDASLYSSRRYAGPGFLLVGDAGSFIDPLSSFGMKKAMVSAWRAAVVVNTCLQKPSMQAAALQYFDGCEREVHLNYRKHSAAWFRTAAGRYPRPFWLSRVEDAAEAEPASDPAEARRSFEALKAKSDIRLKRVDGVRIEKRPGIEGNQVVLHDALCAPSDREPLDYLANVNLPRLAELAERHTQVPELFEAYNIENPPVLLPNFLQALSVLLAKGILIDRYS